MLTPISSGICPILAIHTSAAIPRRRAGQLRRLDQMAPLGALCAKTTGHSLNSHPKRWRGDIAANTGVSTIGNTRPAIAFVGVRLMTMDAPRVAIKQGVDTRDGDAYTSLIFGLWLSLAERSTGGAEVTGSNPVSPTKGVVAHPGERSVRIAEARGSSPRSSTNAGSFNGRTGAFEALNQSSNLWPVTTFP